MVKRAGAVMGFQASDPCEGLREKPCRSFGSGAYIGAMPVPVTTDKGGESTMMSELSSRLAWDCQRFFLACLARAYSVLCHSPGVVPSGPAQRRMAGTPSPGSGVSRPDRLSCGEFGRRPGLFLARPRLSQG
jgi:hypothetical protein